MLVSEQFCTPPCEKVFLIQLEQKCISESVLTDSSLINVFFRCVLGWKSR